MRTQMIFTIMMLLLIMCNGLNSCRPATMSNKHAMLDEIATLEAESIPEWPMKLPPSGQSTVHGTRSDGVRFAMYRGLKPLTDTPTLLFTREGYVFGIPGLSDHDGYITIGFNLNNYPHMVLCILQHWKQLRDSAN